MNLAVFDEKTVLEESGGALSTAVLGFEGSGDGQMAGLEVREKYRIFRKSFTAQIAPAVNSEI